MSARILVVDDDPGIQDVVRFALAGEGFEVDAAADGESALERARTGGYDVLVLDVVLPDVPGTEVCRRLRAELVSRVRAILRRRELDRAEAAAPVREIAGLRLEFTSHEVFLDGERVQLTPSEFKLLALLAERPGEVFSRAEIMRHLWGSDHVGDEHPADVHVSNIRRKIEPTPGRPKRIVTVRGAGYKLDVP